MATAVIQRSAGRLPAVALRAVAADLRRLPVLRVREPRPSAEVTVAVPIVTAITRQLRSLSSVEGEDAAITGGTRSLSRRILALNLTGRL